MAVKFGATCFFNDPRDFSLVAEVAQNYPFLHYVEFRGEHPFLVPGMVAEEDLKRFRKVLKRSGLKSTIHSTMYDVNLSTLNPWMKDANIACYKEYIDVAEQLDAEILVVHGGFIFDEFTGSPLREKFAAIAENHLCETLHELADYARPKGVRIGLENSPPEDGLSTVRDADTHLHILEKVGHPNLGAVFDFGHAYLRRLDYFDFLQRIKPYLLEIHAHNNFGERDDHLGLNNGHLDYQPILVHPDVQEVPFIMEIRSYPEVLQTLEWLKNHSA